VWARAVVNLGPGCEWGKGGATEAYERAKTEAHEHVRADAHRGR
jgi:hypothetical protein